MDRVLIASVPGFFIHFTFNKAVKLETDINPKEIQNLLRIHGSKPIFFLIYSNISGDLKGPKEKNINCTLVNEVTSICKIPGENVNKFTKMFYKAMVVMHSYNCHRSFVFHYQKTKSYIDVLSQFE